MTPSQKHALENFKKAPHEFNDFKEEPEAKEGFLRRLLMGRYSLTRIFFAFGVSAIFLGQLFRFALFSLNISKQVNAEGEPALSPVVHNIALLSEALVALWIIFVIIGMIQSFLRLKRESPTFPLPQLLALFIGFFFLFSHVAITFTGLFIILTQ